MNRNYDFCEINVSRSNYNTYGEVAHNYRIKLQQEMQKRLNASRAYSIKMIQATSHTEIFGGFFYDISNTKRPQSLPDGPIWMGVPYGFENLNSMKESFNELKTDMNDPERLAIKAGVILEDKQIYYSQISFDFYQVLDQTYGTLTFWYKTL